jgi:hypothetical protein
MARIKHPQALVEQRLRDDWRILRFAKMRGDCPTMIRTTVASALVVTWFGSRPMTSDFGSEYLRDGGRALATEPTTGKTSI